MRIGVKHPMSGSFAPGLGNQHINVAVHKMDLIDYSEATFNKIKQDYRCFTTSTLADSADTVSLGPEPLVGN